MKKITALESLRGLAALIVVFCHLASAFLPAMVIGPSSAAIHSNYEKIFLSSPLNILINGEFAVMCFFVLSGFVLSYGFFNKKIDLISQTLKRYFRLMPVVFVSIILAVLIKQLGLFYNLQASSLSNSSWLASFWTQDHSLIYGLWQGFIGTFVTIPDINTPNPVLWTIYHELIGSVLVF